MRTLKTLLFIIIICFSTDSEAQIWKKLAKKAEKAVERTLEKKVEEKAERETDKAFDSTFNSNKKSSKRRKRNKSNAFGMSKANPERVYTFSHKYVMQINTGRKPIELMYYLNNNVPYFGFEIPEDRNKTITIMDLRKEVMFMFMDEKGNKIQMAMQMKLEDINEAAIAENNYAVTPTGNSKTILGYTCKEYDVKGNEMFGKVWVTQDAGVSFSKAFYKTKQKKGINQAWLSMVNGLPMEMKMTDTSKRKPRVTTMTCIKLKAENFSVDTSIYKKLM